MICVLTHRQLRPGSYDEFRRAWEPDEWWPGFSHGYHVRALDDPDQVISFAFWDMEPDAFDRLRDDPHWVELEDRRLKRVAPFQLAARLGGVYEVTERFGGASL